MFVNVYDIFVFGLIKQMLKENSTFLDQSDLLNYMNVNAICYSSHNMWLFGESFVVDWLAKYYDALIFLAKISIANKCNICRVLLVVLFPYQL